MDGQETPGCCDGRARSSNEIRQMGALERLTAALETHGSPVVKGFARCPAHPDSNPSLKVSQGDRGALVNCFAGCTPQAVTEALGLKLADLMDQTATSTEQKPVVVATYRYENENRELLYEVTRLEPKGFRQRCPDGQGGWKYKLAGVRRVLFRLPEIRAALAVDPSVRIVIAEGEKDVNTLVALGIVATCSPGGAGKWVDEYAAQLQGARAVTIIADRDTPGYSHAHQVKASLKASGITDLGIVHATKGKDATDALTTRGLDYTEAFEPVTDKELGRLRQTTKTVSAPTVGVPSMLAVRRASLIEPESVEFLWRPWLPRKLTICDGHPGQGKSTLSIEFAARTTTGGPWPDGTSTTPASVLIVNVEDGAADTIVPRLIASGADLDMVFIVDGLKNVDENGDDDPMAFSLRAIAETKATAKDIGNVGLIVLDPLMALLPGDTNSYKDSEMRSVLRPWSTLADELGACVLLVRHLTKGSQGGPALLRGQGSVGVIGAARCGFAVIAAPKEDSDEDDGSRILAMLKCNVAPIARSLSFTLTGTDNGHARIVWNGESTLTADELFAPQQVTDQGDDMAAIREAMIELFGDRMELPAKECEEVLRHQFGIDHNRGKAKVRTKLGIETRKASGYQQGWIWYWSTAQNSANESTSPSKNPKESTSTDMDSLHSLMDSLTGPALDVPSESASLDSSDALEPGEYEF
jgi:putative DNA primase/helicase